MSDDLSGVQLHFVNSVESANALMSWLGERRPEPGLAIDTETTGRGQFSPRIDRVRLCQIGDGEQGWAIPWREWGGVFREAVNKWQGDFIGHNLPQYDAPILEHEGILIPRHRSRDTRLMSHVIEPTHSTALKNLCARHVDPRSAVMGAQLSAQLSKGEGDNGWTWATIPVDYQPYWAYGALDTVLTARLEPILSEKVRAAGAWDAYLLEMAAAYVTQKMEDNGLCVDRAYAIAAKADFDRQSEELAEYCKNMFGMGPTQNASIIKYLQEAGYEFSKETASGAVSLDKEVLGHIGHPLASLVLAHRQLSRLSTAYLRHFIELTTDKNPMLPYRMNSIGARTGRYTMQNPSLHNLPRRSESNQNAITVRNCFVPKDEDHLLLMIDFDQIEMRELTHLTQDPLLMAAVMDPDVDIFTSMARMTFGDQSIDRKHPLRQRMKSCAYAINYGAGAEKFAATAGLDLETGLTTYNQVKMTFQGIQQMSDLVKQTSNQRLREEGVAYVRSPLTGRIHPAEEGKGYTLVNYLLQGMAAEIMKMKLVELDNAGFGDYMSLSIHDEVIFDFPRGTIQEAAQAALSVMNDYNLLSVPLTAGASLGERWGEKYDYDPFAEAA